MKPYANLHLHTTHSDGVYSPKEIVRIAKREGYRAIAISDHDIGTGYPEMAKACQEENMEYIFAVEFSVRKPKPYHIVGFDFNPEYPPMKLYLEQMAIRNTNVTQNCFDEAVRKGNILGITWEEVLEHNKGVSWMCNNHVFRAMKSKGLVEENEYMDWFNKNFREQRAKYPPLYDFKELPELVKLIKDAGGMAVVAHPHNQLDDIDYLMECGVEGIEVWHPDLTKEEKARAYEIALEKRLYISGGSDHSGLCGGCYSSYSSEEELKKSIHFIEPLSMGTTEKYFREIKERRIVERNNTDLM